MESATSVRNGHICAACQGPAKLACSGCHLVVYCSRDCQLDHRGQHKKWCTSPLNKSTWKPQWAIQGRRPSSTSMGDRSKKYFWGNVPAVDIIHLGGNEGKDYQEDMNILFAASGDPRNVIETIVRLPEEYTNTLSLFINDVDFEIVARNIIVTLIALVILDPTTAAECMLHVWYSALIRQTDVDILLNQILPLAQDVVRQIEDKPSGALLGKTWTFGTHTCRVELPKEKWSALLSLLQVPAGLNVDQAQNQRTIITQAPQRSDYRECRMVLQSPAHRVCAARFREDGLLLPFSYLREEFIAPNPQVLRSAPGVLPADFHRTFFQTGRWPMIDDADPFEGWNWSETVHDDSGPATNDIYGKLFFHIRNKLSQFHTRLSQQGFNFFFYNLDAKKLDDHLGPLQFARVETSNIADVCHLGPAQTIVCLVTLLQDRATNPHATLLTMHMNAVPEALCALKSHDVRKHVMSETALLTKYKYPFLPTAKDPKSVVVDMVTPLVRDSTTLFAQYMTMYRFSDIEKNSVIIVEGGCSMKTTNTVVEKWPYRLKLKPGQSGAQEEFDTRMVGGAIGTERYVEWKRGG